MNGLSAEFEPYGALGELIERFHRCRQLRGIGKGGKFLACRPCRDLRQLQLPSCLDRLHPNGAACVPFAPQAPSHGVIFDAELTHGRGGRHRPPCDDVGHLVQNFCVERVQPGSSRRAASSALALYHVSELRFANWPELVFDPFRLERRNGSRMSRLL
jgi:hypothetical protein